MHKHLTGKDLNAHDAKNDVIACVDMLKILDKQGYPWKDYILSYDDLPGSTINNPEYTMKFGKHMGRTITDLITNESRYIKWMRNNGLVKLSPGLINLIPQK